MGEFGRRVLFASIFIVVIYFLLKFSHTFVGQALVILSLSASSAIAIWEYTQFAKAKGVILEVFVMAIFSIFITSSFFYIFQEYTHPLLPAIVFLLSVFGIFSFYFRDKANALLKVAVASFGLLYIAIPLGMILGIMYFPMVEDGMIWVAYLLVVTKIADVGAYIGGKLLGKNKLAPSISPSKTIEGATCGMFFSLLVSYLFYHLGKEIPLLKFHLGQPEWIYLGLILGCIGQIGDLAESLLKRDSGKKDSSSLPGLGGMLDAVDSLLFNSPILYFYVIISRGIYSGLN